MRSRQARVTASQLVLPDEISSVLKSAKRLEHELDFCGLPHFEIAGAKYYVVERLHFWKNATQEERQNVLGVGNV